MPEASTLKSYEFSKDLHPTIEAFQNYINDSKAHPATSLQQKLMFESYKFFDEKNVICLDMSLSEHEYANPDEIEAGMELLEKMIVAAIGTYQDPTMLMFPILEFFFSHYQGFTGGGKSEYAKIEAALPMMQELTILLRTTWTEYYKK